MSSRSSHAQSNAGQGATSTVNTEQFPAAPRQQGLFEELPGQVNDGSVIRAVLIRAIRSAKKSRAQIAEEISYLSGREFTETSLNKFTAESRSDYRWPGELDRAFCRATGDDTLLKVRAELAGYRVIGAEEIHLLELGREYLRQVRAAQEMEILKARLVGVTL